MFYGKKKKTCMSHFCNTIERFILESCIEHLIKKGFNILDIVPCQDGFMILQELWFDDILKELESAVFDKIGFQVELAVKEFDEACEIPDLIDQIVQPVTETGKSDFQKLCENFEKTHCKIINKSFFIKKCDDGFKIMTEKQRITSYKHITFKNTDGKPTNFIEHWLRNNDMIKCYDDVGVYPDKSKCP